MSIMSLSYDNAANERDSDGANMGQAFGMGGWHAVRGSGLA